MPPCGALAIEKVRSKLIGSGAEPAPSSPEEPATLLKKDMAKWGKIIREKKIRGE